jgi:hypothetical protein
MESQLRLLTDRIRLGNHDLNRSPKYLDYCQTDNDFYDKIGNKLDEFLRVAYYLTNFLISTPPKYVAVQNNSSNGMKETEESLPDFDASEEQPEQSYQFHDKNYNIENLDLPVSVESEFDFNLIFFQAFLSYLKPANYFIHEHELIPFNREESLKESVTRVLANLVQLLIFVRTFNEGDIQDLRNVSLCLFDGFADFFIIHNREKADSKTENGFRNANGDAYPTNASNASNLKITFFEEYPQEAAFLSFILIAYDKIPEYLTYNDLLDSVQFKLNAFQGFPNFEYYNNHLHSYDAVLKDATENSKSVSEFQSHLRSSFKISDLKGKLFQVTRTLTNKILKEISNLEEWTLKDTYLSIDYQRKQNETSQRYESTIANLRLDIEKDIQGQNDSEVNKLRESLEAIQRENKILKEELRLKNDDLEVTGKKLDLLLESKGPTDSSTGGLSYQNFENSNPRLLESIKVSISKLFASKYFGRIDELQSEIIKLRNRTVELEQDQRAGNDHFKDEEDIDGSSNEDMFRDDGSNYGNYSNALVHQPSHHNSPHGSNPSLHYPPQTSQQLVVQQQVPQQSMPIPPMQQAYVAGPQTPMSAPPGVGIQQDYRGGNGYMGHQQRMAVYDPKSSYYQPQQQQPPPHQRHQGPPQYHMPHRPQQLHPHQRPYNPDAFRR